MAYTKMSEEAKICPKCGCPVNPQPDNLIPMVVNIFVPGVGQMIQGRVGRGIGILIAYILGIMCFVVPGVIVWIWAILDAKNFKGE